MHEPAVAITDFILAVECAVFVVLIIRKLQHSVYRTWLIVFFFSIAAGALAGGLTHAYFPNDATGVRLWLVTMASIGVTALSCWNLGAELLHKRWVALRAVAALAFIGYAALILLDFREYRVVVLNYLPAALFLLGACTIAWRRGERALRWAVIGIVFTFVAAAIQMVRVRIPFLEHNALYHLVQAGALMLIYTGFSASRVSTTT
jgi:hypothetical protein